MLNLSEESGQHVFSSVPEGAEAVVLAKLVEQSEHGVLHIARDDKRLMRTAECLQFFAPELEILVFPAWDCLPYDRISPHNNIISQRLETLSRIAGVVGKPIVLTTVNAVLQRVLPREIIEQATLSLASGEDIAREQITEFLVHNGYINVGKVSEHGEYSLRGSIIDIFPPGGEIAYRLDFFGDTLESIRPFDPLTQVSKGKEKQLTLRPASEVLLSEETMTRFRQGYREVFGVSAKEDTLYDAISEGRKYAGMEHWLPLFYEKLETLFDYLPNATVTLDYLAEEAKSEREKLLLDYYQSRKEALDIQTLDEQVYKPIPPESLFLQERQWEYILENRKVASFTPFTVPEAENVVMFDYKQGRNFAVESQQEEKNVFELLQASLTKNKPALIACMSEGSRDRLAGMLENNDLQSKPTDHWQAAVQLPRETLGLAVLGLEQGFETDGLILVTEQDLLGEKILRRPRKSSNTEQFLAEAANFTEGEVVVHKEHGIGRFEGLETVTVDESKHDCLLLTYHGGDKLYLPVENIDLITRYGSEDANVKLDKLGGVAWQERKAKLRKRIKVTAEELLGIAAQRALKKAEIYPGAEGVYHEFCARFPYAETEDQLRAIQEVEEDLVSGKPMDRLVCGDVGFGKTEVALRAAFMVALSDQHHGQVVVVTPTTLLARQHYQTFKERFAGLPVNIRQLSRLVPNVEAKKVKEELAEGKVDIVIGTHALLAKSIEFKKLSLLIVDEEQHFGVKQKEKLKRLRADTHVLTLTATPIPRTLQLSLAGVRDLSLITTPPVDRLAVRTFVMPFDHVVIREAILREHYRGGRIFYVCPRIADLDKIAKRLSELVPEVKMAVAHGQMPAKQLDDIMRGFYEGSFDLLLSTSIIESGIDIASANTIIIERPDMFGLAQLYQMRGRVGRSKIRAYAYLVLPNRKILTKQAQKRLEVMQKLDTLGAGFTLASYDMDIRGFGNLLGDEQSGNIKEVGVELFQQMMEEAIQAQKAMALGEEVEEKAEQFSPQINISASVLIPEEYVPDLSLRLGLYRRIAHLETESDIEAMGAELIDRFGPLPEEVKHLLEVVKIKQVCRKLGIEKLDAGPRGATIMFYNNTFSNPEALLAYIQQHPESVKLKPDQKVIFTEKQWDSVESRLKGIAESLQDVAGLAA